MYEGDPLSPSEGEAAQGEHPLDPLSVAIILWGCPSGGTPGKVSGN